MPKKEGKPTQLEKLSQRVIEPLIGPFELPVEVKPEDTCYCIPLSPTEMGVVYAMVDTYIQLHELHVYEKLITLEADPKLLRHTQLLAPELEQYVAWKLINMIECGSGSDTSGTQGPAGPAGATGPAGPAGPAGPKGDTPACCDTPPDGGTYPPPPDGTVPPGSYPPPPPPPNGEDGGRVTLVCEDNVIYENIGTHSTLTVGNLRHGGIASPLDGVPINVQEIVAANMLPLIDNVIANTGLLPAGASVVRVNLGWKWIGCVELYIGLSLAGFDLATNIHPTSEIYQLTLDYIEAGKPNQVIPLLPDKHYEDASWSKEFDVEPAISAAIRWIIGEATPTQHTLISAYNTLGAILLDAAMMPALPNVFGIQPTSPRFNLCLDFFDWRYGTMGEVFIRASGGCDLYEHSGTYSNDWTNMEHGNLIYDGTTGVKANIAKICLAYHLGYGAGAKIGFNQQAWKDANPGLIEGEYFGVSGSDGGIAEQFMWVNVAYNTGNAFVLKFSSILAIRVTVAAIKYTDGTIRKRDGTTPVCAGWTQPPLVPPNP